MEKAIKFASINNLDFTLVTPYVTNIGLKKVKALLKELMTRKLGRRGIYAACELKEGEVIIKKNIMVKRPYIGIPAENESMILGKKIRKKVGMGMPIDHSNLED